MSGPVPPSVDTFSDTVRPRASILGPPNWNRLPSGVEVLNLLPFAIKMGKLPLLNLLAIGPLLCASDSANILLARMSQSVMRGTFLRCKCGLAWGMNPRFGCAEFVFSPVTPTGVTLGISPRVLALWYLYLAGYSCLRMLFS